MGRALVSQRYGAAQICLTLGLAAHQHLDAAGKHGNLAILARDRVRQIVDGADEMGDFLFDVFHEALVALLRACVKREPVWQQWDLGIFTKKKPGRGRLAC